jgi:hypothetical protein
MRIIYFRGALLLIGLIAVAMDMVANDFRGDQAAYTTVVAVVR